MAEKVILDEISALLKMMVLYQKHARFDIVFDFADDVYI